MRGMLLLVLLPGCIHTMTIEKALKETSTTLNQANEVHARLCAPKSLADAQSNVDFAQLELRQGHLRRANEHLTQATTDAQRALEEATPAALRMRTKTPFPMSSISVLRKPKILTTTETKMAAGIFYPMGMKTMMASSISMTPVLMTLRTLMGTTMRMDAQKPVMTPMEMV